MNQDIDRKAANELKALAVMYSDRGNMVKAAELLHLADQILRRMEHDNILQMSDWHTNESEEKKA